MQFQPEQPTEFQKKIIDKLCREFIEYFSTPEGAKHGDRIVALVKQFEAGDMARFNSLSDTEKLALKFIAEEIVAGRRPTVRTVARAVGFSSSRSGMRIVERLITTGFVKRQPEGLLIA